MSDTIAAIATAPGPSAIGVVRLSGPDTCTVLDRVFRPKNGRPMSRQEPRRLVLGDVLDRDGQVIDSALAVLFPGPGSYTGQDCGELQCHGSPVVLDAALAAMLAAGARQAKGGEFTRRAFLNGRMDLLQAEAVADLIDAETAQAAHNAVGQLEGVLSRTVAEIYDGLMAIVSRFYAVVDYPDEDIGDLQREDMLDTLRRAENRLEELLATFSRGKLLKLGVPTVILGRPNVGKSSLLNALLGYDRAIVTDVAGTTRDTVEEKVRVGHVLLRLCDTAGIHQTEDAVEKIGVERARAAARQASLALLVLDGSTPLTDADREAMDLARQAPDLLVAVNKSDLPRAVDIGRLVRQRGVPVRPQRRGGVRPVRRHRSHVPRRGGPPRGAADQCPPGRRRVPGSGLRPQRPQRPAHRHDPGRGAHRCRGRPGGSGGAERKTHPGRPDPDHFLPLLRGKIKRPQKTPGQGFPSRPVPDKNRDKARLLRDVPPETGTAFGEVLWT